MTYTSTKRYKDTYKRFKSVILMALLVSFCFLPIFSVKAYINYAGDFDGSLPSIIEFGTDDFSFERTDAFSIEQWFYIADIHLGNAQVLVSKELPNGKGYALYLSSIDSNQGVVFRLVNTWGTNMLYADVRNTGYGFENWNHIVMTYDGSSDISGIKIYMNGVSKSISFFTNNLTESTITDGKFTIGTVQVAGAEWYGYMDEIRIWNKELTFFEVTALYNIGDGTFNIPDGVEQEALLSTYRLDENGGTDVFDATGTRHGTSVNLSYTTGKVIGEPAEPPPAQLDFAPTITSPTEAQEIFGNTVTAQGECWYSGVDIIDKDTNQRFNEPCHYPIRVVASYYYFQDPIILDYSTSTGRVAGYVEFSTPLGYFAGLIRQDKNDLKIFKYNNDLGIFYDELDYWFGTVDSETIFKFYAVDEPANRTKPIFDYYLLYGFAFEDIPPTIIPDEPITTHLATRDETQLIKGNYYIEFERDFGEHTITAQSMIEHPYIVYSAESNPVNFTLLETLLPPPYSWTEPILWYSEVSKFEQPTLFLSVIFDMAEGTLKPLMSQINKFTEFFNKEQAQQDALNITGAMKTVISYTRLFDNFFGSLPISWALILLMIVYIAKFVIIYTAKAIQTFKPL